MEKNAEKSVDIADVREITEINDLVVRGVFSLTKFFRVGGEIDTTFQIINETSEAVTTLPLKEIFKIEINPDEIIFFINGGSACFVSRNSMRIHTIIGS